MANETIKDFGPLGPNDDPKTPFNYFIKLRDTFQNGSIAVDYLMRLRDEKTGERIGLVYAVIFQHILLQTNNSFGYLVDILGNREDPKSLKFIPIRTEILVHRFSGYFTQKEIEDAIKTLIMLNKLEYSKEYKCYRVVDYLKHCGKEQDYRKYYRDRIKKYGDDND